MPRRKKNVLTDIFGSDVDNDFPLEVPSSSDSDENEEGGSVKKRDLKAAKKSTGKAASSSRGEEESEPVQTRGRKNPVVKEQPESSSEQLAERKDKNSKKNMTAREEGTSQGNAGFKSRRAPVTGAEGKRVRRPVVISYEDEDTSTPERAPKSRNNASTSEPAAAKTQRREITLRRSTRTRDADSSDEIQPNVPERSRRTRKEASKSHDSSSLGPSDRGITKAEPRRSTRRKVANSVSKAEGAGPSKSIDTNIFRLQKVKRTSGPVAAKGTKRNISQERRTEPSSQPSIRRKRIRIEDDSSDSDVVIPKPKRRREVARKAATRVSREDSETSPEANEGASGKRVSDHKDEEAGVSVRRGKKKTTRSRKTTVEEREGEEESETRDEQAAEKTISEMEQSAIRSAGDPSTAHLRDISLGDPLGLDNKVGMSAASKYLRGPKPRYTPLTREEIEKECMSLLTLMFRAYEADQDAHKEGRPAVEKVQLMDQLQRTAAKRGFTQVLLELGALTVLREWLKPHADGTSVNIQVEAVVLDVLWDMGSPRGLPDHLEQARGLGARVMLIAGREHRDADCSVGERLRVCRVAQRLKNRWFRQIHRLDEMRLHGAVGSSSTAGATLSTAHDANRAEEQDTEDDDEQEEEVAALPAPTRGRGARRSSGSRRRRTSSVTRRLTQMRRENRKADQASKVNVHGR